MQYFVLSDKFRITAGEISGMKNVPTRVTVREQKRKNEEIPIQTLK